MPPFQIWHPFLDWSSASLAWVLALTAGTALLLFMRMELIGRRLRNSTAPLGVVSLSLALTTEESESILRQWDIEGREAARRQLELDYWFVPCYSTSLAVLGVLAAHFFARNHHDALRDVALLLAWGQWLVGLLDFAETTTLLRMVHAYPVVPDGLTRFTGWFTRGKYLLIFLTLGVAAFALLPLLGLASG